MDEKRYYVYEWYVIDTNEVFYVGKGTKARCKTKKRENKYFMNMINTHDCTYRIVKDGMTEQEAFQMEIELIKHYRENTNYRLTNIADGGENPPKMCGDLSPTKRPDVREKLSNSIKRDYQEHPERHIEVSRNLKRFYQSETGQKCASEKSKANWNNPEIREKIVSKIKATTQSEEYRKRKSEIMKKAYSNEEIRKRMSGGGNPHAKKVCQYTLSGELIAEYNSLIEAEKATAIPFKSISKVLRGANKTAGGFYWKYNNSQDNTVPSQDKEVV